MCLAIPAEIEKITDGVGTVALAAARSDVILALVPEAKVGDWVLVHAGCAIAVLDPAEARETFDVLKEMDIVTDKK